MNSLNSSPKGWFRIEALQHQRDKALGEAAILRPLSFGIYTGFAALVWCALFAFAFLGEYTLKAQVQGYLVPNKGTIRVHAPGSGVISEIQVRDGQRVIQGEVLFVLLSDRTSTAGREVAGNVIEDLKRRRESLLATVVTQRELGTLLAQQAEFRLSKLSEELTGIERERALQERRLATARAQVERFRTLARDNFISPMQLQQKIDEQAAQEAVIETLARSRLSVEREIGSLKTEIPLIALRVVERIAQTEREVISINQDLAEAEVQQGTLIRAPAAGIVTALQGSIGKTIDANLPLLTIVPEETLLEAVLLAPTHAVGFVQQGDPVRIRYNSFPYERFGHYSGVVQAIDASALAPNEVDAPIRPTEPVYRITVALDLQIVEAYGRHLRLKPGMTLEADIVLGKRKLWEWVVEPLYTVTGKL